MSLKLCKLKQRSSRLCCKNTGYGNREGYGFKILKTIALSTFFPFFGEGSVLPRHISPDRLHGNGAFQTLFLHFTAKAVWLFYVSIDKQIGSGTTSAAIELGPAVFTVRARIYVEPCESSGQLHVKGSTIEVAQLVFLIAHKLMAGIDVSLWSDGHIFAPRAAASSR